MTYASRTSFDFGQAGWESLSEIRTFDCSDFGIVWFSDFRFSDADCITL